MIIKTQGRARQKTMTLARKAGVEVRAVVFTRPQLIRALGVDPGKHYGAKRDTCLGRCWMDGQVIWLRLPVSLTTIAHEVMHLVTNNSHSTASFKLRAAALSHGHFPAQCKPQWYEVTVTTVTKYRVLGLTPSAAKTSYRRNGEYLGVNHIITARRLKK